jgi:hypothetical protein
MARMDWRYVLVISALIGATAFAQDPPAQPNIGVTWKVTQQVFNDTPYDLLKLSQTVTEATSWDGAEPARTIPAGGKNVYAIKNSTPGHGLVMLVTYAAYDKGAFKGMVIAASGIDCNDRTPYFCLPTKFHRWEGVYCDSRGAVRGVWDDNEGDPENYWTGIHFTTDPKGTCIGGVQAPTPDPTPAPLKGEVKAPVPWSVTGGLMNQTPYTLRRRNVWNSEGTHFGDTFPSKYPPEELQPQQRIDRAWSAFNIEMLHGPAVLVMYDAFWRDQYIGSLVYESAVDCTIINPKDGCMGFESWSRATGAAVPGHHLMGYAEPDITQGIPPFGFYVRNSARGGPGGL